MLHYDLQSDRFGFPILLCLTSAHEYFNMLTISATIAPFEFSKEYPYSHVSTHFHALQRPFSATYHWSYIASYLTFDCTLEFDVPSCLRGALLTLHYIFFYHVSAQPRSFKVTHLACPFSQPYFDTLTILHFKYSDEYPCSHVLTPCHCIGVPTTRKPWSIYIITKFRLYCMLSLIDATRRLTMLMTPAICVAIWSPKWPIWFALFIYPDICTWVFWHADNFHNHCLLQILSRISLLACIDPLPWTAYSCQRLFLARCH